ncbi:unnamed protein product [Brassica oleracea var. botrytis]|uniref:Uncharacterized protein n=1 Tax=Brassica oleracea TaxID=3712 RepID=A0A3P6DJT5_BRAOL|nr:unnamed protein product [Brassica oleracea]
MTRYQSLIAAALLRASRRLTSPAVSSVRRTFSSSSLLPRTTTTLTTLPRSSPLAKFYFSSSSSSSPPSVPPPKASLKNGHEEDTFECKKKDQTFSSYLIADYVLVNFCSILQLGDGGDGGGVVLRGVPWGERVLSIASQVLKESEKDLQLFAFRTSPRGYVYIRLDKPSHEYGCPSMDELEEFSREYKKRLDDAGDAQVVPEDLALEVSSPGAERLLKVPEDLHRFKEMPMTVSYEEEANSRKTVKSTVLLLESVDAESEICIWKLADVRENRDPESKGRPLSRKQKDLRFKLPFSVHMMITLYLD